MHLTTEAIRPRREARPLVRARRISAAGSELPALHELGEDLLRVEWWRPWLAIVRPAAMLWLLFATLASQWWPLAPFVGMLLFLTLVAATHDLVHGSMRLSPWLTDVLLFVTGALVLESGHAYRFTHLLHHRTFPQRSEPEGAAAHSTWIRSLAAGPAFLPRLWCFAWRELRSNRRERAWLAAEAGFAIGCACAGLALAARYPAFAGYEAIVILGSWTYPLLNVWLPHHDFGPTALTQTRSLHGRLIPRALLGLAYHLEHHLYPQVPCFRLHALAQRIDGVVRRGGAAIVNVP